MGEEGEIYFLFCLGQSSDVLITEHGSVTAVSVHAGCGARKTLFTVKDKTCLCHRKFSKNLQYISGQEIIQRTSKAKHFL